MQKLKIKKLTKTAKLPNRVNDTDAGFDLYSDEYKKVPVGKVTLVSTGIAINTPHTDYEDFSITTYGRIAPRSGLAVNNGIDVFAGVVDSGYRGEIKVALYNSGEKEYNIKPGDRIAQLIITLILTPEIEEVKELDETPRGTNGFGESGKWN